MGIAVADEASTYGCLKDGGLKDPKVLLRMTERNYRFAMNAAAVAPLGKTQ